LRIRTASTGDITAILNLAAQAGNVARWSEAEYRRILAADAGYELVVAEQQQVIGFVIAHVIGAEWEIENVAVALGWRRGGVGSALLNEVADRAARAGAKAIYLEVRESNSSARELYRRCGFREAGRRSAYYSLPSEDAVIYEKHLVPQ
jgi:ribosomal-protein-alanine N-acetyltransferase